MQVQTLRSLSVLLASSIVLSWSASASSAEIETLAEADWDAPIAIDLQGPATSGTLVSSASGNGGQADAVLDISGDAAVKIDGAIANGQRGNTLHAVTRWSETITNFDVVPRTYRADFSIPEIQLFFSGSGFHGAPQDQRTIGYQISVNAGPGNSFWSSFGTLKSGTTGHVLEKGGTDLGGVKSPSDLRYTFAPSSHSIPIAVVPPAGSVTVVYEIDVVADIPGFEIFADASVGDPFGTTRAQIALVDLPEPGVGSSLVVGLAMLAGAGRRRR